MPLNIEKQVVKHVIETRSLKIDRKTLLQLLNEAGLSIPANASVYMVVPGDGDWSNTMLDVEEDCPIHVTFKSEWSE